MRDSIKSVLLAAPVSQFDEVMHPFVQKWDDPPTSLQLLEVLDLCILCAHGSDLVITLLQTVYDETLQREQKKHEDNVPLATWRKM